MHTFFAWLHIFGCGKLFSSKGQSCKKGSKGSKGPNIDQKGQKEEKWAKRGKKGAEGGQKGRKWAKGDTQKVDHLNRKNGARVMLIMDLLYQ
jgi:hypothetical protein